MIKFRILAAVMAVLLVTQDVTAWPGGRGGSSSSRSSSSRSSSSGSSSSRSSSSSFRPSSGSSGSKSSFRPSSGNTAPKVTSNQPGYRSSQATARRDSAASYQASKPTAKPTIKTPSGASKPIPDRHIAATPPNASATRTTRVTNVYNTTHYGGWSQHPYQHDSFHPMLTGYLLGRLSSPVYYGPTRDWVYLHYDSMDPLRREELFRENAQLRADVERLRSSKATVSEPSLDIDADLLYDDDVAATIYRHNSGGFWTHAWHFFLICCCVMLILAIGYVLFYHDWE